MKNKPIKLNSINKANIPPIPGIYWCITDNHKGGIRRLRKNDLNGVIYIGESKNMKRRLNNLRLSLINKTFGLHSVGDYFYKQKFNKDFPPKSILIRYKPCSNHKIQERTLLLKYLKVYGDLPILNFKRPNI